MRRSLLLSLWLCAACGDPTEPQGAPPDGPAAAARALDGAALEALAPATPLAASLPIGPAENAPALPVHRAAVARDEPRAVELTLQNGHCFRVAAVAPGLGDIDLFLYEPDGTPVQQDTAPDATPVLGLHRPICPTEPTAYRLELLALERAGTIAFQVFTAR